MRAKYEFGDILIENSILNATCNYIIRGMSDDYVVVSVIINSNSYAGFFRLKKDTLDEYYINKTCNEYFSSLKFKKLKGML
jgi:hypothetical protein